MDTATLVSFLHESLFLILVFCAFMMFAMIRGRQSLINLILGLYVALLITLEFPYFESFLSGEVGDQSSDSIIMIIIFAVFTLLSTMLFGRLMPIDPDETAFEGFGKKALFAIMASVLVMAYSYHVLPVTDLITPGSPIHTLFASEAHFFWWMLLPLLGLFFL